MGIVNSVKLISTRFTSSSSVFFVKNFFIECTPKKKESQKSLKIETRFFDVEQADITPTCGRSAWTKIVAEPPLEEDMLWIVI